MKTHIGWDKISESHESDKELIFRKYKQLIQLSKKKDKPIKKWAKNLNRCLPKKDIRMTNKTVKQCSSFI